MGNDERDSNFEAEALKERLGSAVQAAVEREREVETLSSWWRDIREGNNFRKSLTELFSGD